MWRVSEKKDPPTAAADRVSPRYSRLLREAVRAAGLSRKDLLASETAPSSTVLWRVLKHRESPAVKAADDVRARLLELRPDLETAVPPPSVAVEGVDHFAWIKIGSELFARDQREFSKMLRLVRHMYDAYILEHGAASAIEEMAAESAKAAEQTPAPEQKSSLTGRILRRRKKGKRGDGDD
jgi:hypothetical protein